MTSNPQAVCLPDRSGLAPVPGERGQLWILPWVREVTSLSPHLRAAILHPGGMLCSLQERSQDRELSLSSLGRAFLRQYQSRDQEGPHCQAQGWRGRYNENQPHRGSDSSLQASVTSSSDGTIIFFCPSALPHLWVRARMEGHCTALCLKPQTSSPGSTGWEAEATEKSSDLLWVTAPSPPSKVWLALEILLHPEDWLE